MKVSKDKQKIEYTLDFPLSFSGKIQQRGLTFKVGVGDGFEGCNAVWIYKSTPGYGPEDPHLHARNVV